jgi:hypothetical protein
MKSYNNSNFWYLGKVVVHIRHQYNRNGTTHSTFYLYVKSNLNLKTINPYTYFLFVDVNAGFIKQRLQSNIYYVGYT